MKVGMLWFDDGPDSVKEKVARAASFYSTKYGEKATVCMVHPQTLGKVEGRVGGIVLLPERAMLPNHFWIGVEESPAAVAAAERPHSRGKKARAGAKPAARKRAGGAGARRKNELRPAA